MVLIFFIKKILIKLYTAVLFQNRIWTQVSTYYLGTLKFINEMGKFNLNGAYLY